MSTFGSPLCDHSWFSLLFLFYIMQLEQVLLFFKKINLFSII